MRVSAGWFKQFFDPAFYNPASPAAVAHAPREVTFLLGRLRLKKGAQVLDLCCGPGRHSVLLAKKGYAVTGVDYSPGYLKEAAAAAKKAGVAVRFMRGDMRRLKFRAEFDAALNLFTSFGYFKKYSDDVKTLKGVARALKPGGLFVLDVVSGDYVRRNFRPRNWHRLEDGSYHLEEVELTKDGALNSWTRLKKGKSSEKRFFTRLYDKPRITAALRAAGLTPLKFWGSFSGAPLSPKHNRLIVLSVK